MKTDGRRIYTQAEGAQTNLVVELLPGEELIPYCRNMMELNTVPGLLPVRHQILDGVYIMKYNTNGKLRLQDYLMQRQITHEQGLALLRNLTDSLLQLGEYFLSMEQCILDPEYIYVGDGLRAYLICLPLEAPRAERSASEVQDFYEKLLSRYFATADCTDYDDMFKWVYRASPFDLITLRDQFLSTALDQEPEMQQTPAQTAPRETPAQPEPAAVRPAQAQPVPAPEPEPPAPPKASVLNIPGGGSFAVPSPVQQNKKPKKEKAPKPEKKKRSFWPFGSHGDAPKSGPAESEAPAAAVPAWQPSAPSSDQQWERGTILVTGAASEEGTVLVTPDSQHGCYLTHNNTRVEVNVLPFIIGQHNTTKHVDYAIYNNSNVSRQHATILMSGGRYMVQDNHSLNGTFVNGQRLAADQMVPVRDGDEIRLYNEVFVFHTT